MPNIDLGHSAETNRFETERDIRMTLEIKSSDPVASAYALLVSPNAPHLGRFMEPEIRAAIAETALERYAETGSVAASDYADLLTVDDGFVYEWSPERVFDPAPIGRAS
jgi:hypothetical protein